MARNAKKAAQQTASAEQAVEQQVQVQVAQPAPEVAPEVAQTEGQNITPELAARFLILDAIKESAASDDLKKQAGQKGKGVYATLTDLCAKAPELFVKAWTRVKEDIANNAGGEKDASKGCAVIAGCELSKKTGKYNIPRSASVAASELLYAVGNAIPLVDAATGAVLSFGKIRDANGAHRRAAMMATADDAEKSLIECLSMCHGFAGELQKIQAAHKAGIGRLSDHIDRDMLAAMRAVSAAISANLAPFAEVAEE